MVHFCSQLQVWLCGMSWPWSAKKMFWVLMQLEFRTMFATLEAAVWTVYPSRQLNHLTGRLRTNQSTRKQHPIFLCHPGIQFQMCLLAFPTSQKLAHRGSFQVVLVAYKSAQDYCKSFLEHGSLMALGLSCQHTSHAETWTRTCPQRLHQCK